MQTDILLDEKKELTLTPEERAKVDNYKNAINFTDSKQIIQYGTASQNRLNGFADSVLSAVRNKDMGEVGTILSELSVNLKQFDAATAKRSGIFGLFESLKKRIARLQAAYNTVEKNIAKIELQLEKHVQTLLKDTYIFDQQYIENWNYYKEISLYIQAGEEKIVEMKEVVLPAAEKEARETQDSQLMQQYNDLEQQLIRFEKKIHDLKLSRIISVQLAPQIRLVQNNSTALIDKIQSTLVNTLPLWKNQMVLSLGIMHTQQALSAQRTVTDATNELLRRNSEMLRQSTTQVALENERSIVDIDTIKKANNELFAAMDDLVKIQAEGRQKRLAAEVEIKAVEEELKARLLAVGR